MNAMHPAQSNASPTSMHSPNHIWHARFTASWIILEIEASREYEAFRAHLREQAASLLQAQQGGAVGDNLAFFQELKYQNIPSLVDHCTLCTQTCSCVAPGTLAPNPTVSYSPWWTGASSKTLDWVKIRFITTVHCALFTSRTYAWN